VSRVYPVDVNRSEFDARPVIVLPDDFYDYVNEAVYVLTRSDLPALISGPAAVALAHRIGHLPKWADYAEAVARLIEGHSESPTTDGGAA
jgi:hypothetical protein